MHVYSFSLVRGDHNWQVNFLSQSKIDLCIIACVSGTGRKLLDAVIYSLTENYDIFCVQSVAADEMYCICCCILCLLCGTRKHGANMHYVAVYKAKTRPWTFYVYTFHTQQVALSFSSGCDSYETSDWVDWRMCTPCFMANIEICHANNHHHQGLQAFLTTPEVDVAKQLGRVHQIVKRIISCCQLVVLFLVQNITTVDVFRPGFH